MFNPCAPIIQAGSAIARAVRHAAPHRPPAPLSHAAPAGSPGHGVLHHPLHHASHHAAPHHAPMFGPPIPKLPVSCVKAPGTAFGSPAANANLAAAKDLAAQAIATRGGSDYAHFGNAFYNPETGPAPFDLIGGNGKAVGAGLSAAVPAATSIPFLGFFTPGISGISGIAGAAKAVLVAGSIAAAGVMTVGMTADVARDTTAPTTTSSSIGQPVTSSATLPTGSDQTAMPGATSTNPAATQTGSSTQDQPGATPLQPGSGTPDTLQVAIPDSAAPLTPAGPLGPAIALLTPSTTGNTPPTIVISPTETPPAGTPDQPTLTEQTAIPEPASLAAFATATAAALLMRRRKHKRC